jgi:hypothetical protein
VTLSADHGPVVAVNPAGFDGVVRNLISFNDANTAYRAGVGVLTMDYRLTSAGSALQEDAASRFGHGFAQRVESRFVPASQAGVLPDSAWSLVTVTPESLLLSTVKMPASGNGVILRLYNPMAVGVDATLQFAGDVLSARETSLLEADGAALPVQGKGVAVAMGSREVKTLRVALGRVTSVAPQGVVPSGYALLQNFPNPFNPSTIIRYTLGAGGVVTLRITNVLGQTVRAFAPRPGGVGTGEFLWNGSDDTGRSVATGVYFATLQVNEGDHTVFRATRTMLLLR